MAQCCPFFQSQPSAECSYTVDMQRDQTPGSRLPWLLCRSLIPFLPSSCFPLASVVSPSGAPLPNHLQYIPAVRACVVIMCVCSLGYLDVHKQRLPSWCYLIAFVSCPEALIRSARGASSNIRLTNWLLTGLSGPTHLSEARHISEIILHGLLKTNSRPSLSQANRFISHLSAILLWGCSYWAMVTWRMASWWACSNVLLHHI